MQGSSPEACALSLCWVLLRVMQTLPPALLHTALCKWQKHCGLGVSPTAVLGTSRALGIYLIISKSLLGRLSSPLFFQTKRQNSAKLKNLPDLHACKGEKPRFKPRSS